MKNRKKRENFLKVRHLEIRKQTSSTGKMKRKLEIFLFQIYMNRFIGTEIPAKAASTKILVYTAFG